LPSRTLLASSALLACICCFWRPRLGGAKSPQQTQVQNALAGLVKPGSPGFAILVRYKGRTDWERCYGIRDLRTKAAIDPATNFRLASFTKQFTAMAVMLLVHDGKLHYDDSLTAIFPEFPRNDKAVTVRHLLQHTSGLPDYEELMDAVVKVHGPV
jgi:CubicO group peptidase (beta-lactamase class C family)